MNLETQWSFEAHASTMRRLKDKLSTIDLGAGSATRIAYVDYPAHYNIGDLLINMGTEAFFSAKKANIGSRYAIGDLGKYDVSRDRFDLGRRIGQLDRDIADGAILVFHGGGNLGDIWPHHQRLRETLLERYRGVKTIVLPQSVQFNDHAQMKAAARSFGSHGDAKIYVRDGESLRFVTERAQIPGEVMPDMAHHLWDEPSAFPHPHQTGSGVLVQTRNDSEGPGERPAEDVFDWDDVVSSTDRLAYYAYAAWRRLNPAPRTAPTYRAWYAVRDHVVRKGIAHFQTAAHVKTDRLHGVILAALLNKKVMFDDRQNIYRKLHRYHQSWLSDSPLITAA